MYIRQLYLMLPRCDIKGQRNRTEMYGRINVNHQGVVAVDSNLVELQMQKVLGILFLE